MKRTILLLAFWLGFYVTFAQSESKKDSIRKSVPKVVLTDISTLLPQITPKSPNVASLERYGQIPVSMYTGLAQIEIPIFQIKIGSLSIPIKLVYHHSGNKVSDNPSWVGLGWSLTGQYAVSRSLRGKRDEDDFTNNNDLLRNPIPDLTPYQVQVQCLTQTLQSELNDYTDWGKDIERDIFTYSLPKKSNSFVFTPSGYIWQENDKSKVSYTGSLNAINLVDEDGFRYDFSAGETTNGYTSAWNLTTIQGNKPTDKAIFNYINNSELTYNADMIDTEVYKSDIGGQNPEYAGDPGIQSTTNSNQSATINSSLLSEIFFPNGKIVFTSIPDREDGLGRSLSEIEIHGYNVNSNSYSLIKKYVLVQSYRDGRLFLDGVNMLGNDGSTIGSYTCTYNSTALPSKDSRSKDFWGYFNGQNNATLIHGFSILLPTSNGNSTLYNIGTQNPSGVAGNRNPNETLMKARVLTQLTYPTGGFSNFDYEAHRHDGGQIAGGLRIKSIVSNDGNGKTITKTYKYGASESGNGTYRDIWLNIPNKTYATVQRHRRVRPAPQLPEFPDFEFKIRVFSSANTQPLNPNEGSVVTYPIVTEYEDNGSGANGKTVYTFKDDEGDGLIEIPSAFKPFQQSKHWNRGQLLNKTVYGSNGTKKYEQINAYSTISSSTSPTLGYLIGKSIVPISGYNLDNGGCLVFDNESSNVNYTPIRPTNWFQGIVKQTRSEEYFYDDTDDSKFVYKKSETDYDNTYFQPKEMRNFESDGKININRYRYVTDYDTHNSSIFNVGSMLYWMKENNQLNIPIEQVQMVKLPSESDNRVLDGQITDFLFSNYGGYNYVYPKEIHLFENGLFPTPVTEPNYTLSYLSVGILWKDFRYIKRLESDSYDSFGNLLQFKLVGNSLTAFTYSTNPLNDVFHVFPISETKNSGGITTYTTNFAYNIPLLGVKEITAPNGLKAYFEYDSFGRFKRAKDHNSDILKEHDYNFALNNNFIKEFIPRVANSTLSGDYNNYQTIINYFDGLGRPTQTVNYVAGFNALNDIVTNASLYDNLGRIEKSFIPFPNVGGGATAPLPTVVHGDTAPYSNVSEYDNSPLNRPKKAFGVGQSWRSANKYIENKYLVVPSGTIRKYDLTSNGANVNGTWDVSLYKNVSISERGKEVIEYKDNQGKLIQKDLQDGAGSYTSTHYLYDEFDRLKYVIQPQSFQNSMNFVENDSYFQAGVFCYKYDKRGRVIESHVPSGGWTYSVYDKLDRQVLEQSEKQRQGGINKWKFIKFDAIGRDILKGEISSSSNRQSLQNDFEAITQAYEEWNNGYSNVSFPSSATIGTNEDREIKIYDHYDFIEADWGFNANPNYLAFYPQYTDNKGLLSRIIARDPDGSRYYNTVFYYDNKGRVIQTYQVHHLGGVNYWTKPIITNFQYNFNGQILIQRTAHQRDNATTIEDKTENQYDHVGRLKKVFHTINGVQTEIASLTYDAVGRLIQKKIRPDATFTVGGTADIITRPSINGLVTLPNTKDSARRYILLEPTIEVNAFNLTSYLAKISPNAPQGTPINGLQTIDFSYHIRDWLLGINLDGSNNPNPNATEGDLFSYKLGYDDAGFYDGNIGKQEWQTADNSNAPSGIRSFIFDYDDLSRLLSATYTGLSTENYGIPSISYDKNGNILTLQRNGKIGSSYGLMDNLTYSYSGNRLNSVTDAISSDNEVDFVPRGGNSYDYYNDGSLKSDNNKEITNIIYDTYLDKPKEIQLTGSRWVKMYYDGSGRLFKREFSTGEYWDYVANLIYKNGQIHQMGTPEGRATYSGSTAQTASNSAVTPTSIAGQWNYEFFYTDHLGNTRVSFGASGSNLITNDISHFDPTGILLNGAGQVNTIENRFKWQGKESLELFGLSNINDFGARYADKTINRWWGVDALASQMRRFTPYNINFNNPLRFIDPDGMAPDGDLYNEKGKPVGTDNVRDGRVYVVTNKEVASKIKKSGGVVADASKVESAVELPTAETRAEMKKAVDRSNSRNDKRTDEFKGDDNEGKFHEEGGVYGTNRDGKEVVIHAKPGEKADPIVNAMATVEPSNPANPNSEKIAVDGSFHVHPAGHRNPPANTIGAPSGYFNQSPTDPEDYNEAKGYPKNSYVLGAGNGRVTIYNSKQIVGTFPLKQFTSIGIKK